MKKRASLFLGSALILLSSAAVAQTPPPGYEPPPGYQPQQQYPQQQYPQQQYPQQQYPQQPQPYYGQPQPYAAPMPAPVLRQPRRFGFFFGGSLGGGEMYATADGASSSYSLGGFGLELHGGFMILPRLGILLEASALVGSDDLAGGDGYVYSATIAHSAGIIAAQLWLTDMFWLRGGFGGGTYEISTDYGSDSTSGPAFMAAAGVDLIHSPNFTLDLHGRWLYSSFDGFSVSNLALQIGVNWYSVVF